MTAVAPVLPVPAPAPAPSGSTGSLPGSADEFEAVARRVEARSGGPASRGDHPTDAVAERDAEAAEVDADAAATAEVERPPGEAIDEASGLDPDADPVAAEGEDAAAQAAAMIGAAVATTTAPAVDPATESPSSDPGAAGAVEPPVAAGGEAPIEAEVAADLATDVAPDLATAATPTSPPVVETEAQLTDEPHGGAAIDIAADPAAELAIDPEAPADPADAAPAPGPTSDGASTPSVSAASAPQPSRADAVAATRAAATPEIAQSAGAEHTEAWDQVASVVRPLRTAPDGSHRIALRLRPDDLGTVHLEVAMRDGRLSLHAVADSTAGRDVLSQSLPQLRSALTDAGIDLGTLDVSTGTSGGDAGEAGRSPNAPTTDHRSSAPGRGAAPGGPAVSAPTPTAARPGAAPGSVDLSL